MADPVEITQSALELMALQPGSIQITQSAVLLMVGPLSLSITCQNPPPATVGAPYTHVFPAVGGTPPYSFNMSQVPAGMFFDQATGELHGTAFLAGTFAFTVEVTDAVAATDTVDCSVTSVPASISLGGLRIWFYGVKRRKKTPPTELCGCPEAPHVKKAV